MNIWHEGFASRGPDEIGSCVLLYCRKLAVAGIIELNVYSDSCGGQNRNKKIALLWLHICHKFEFEKITHTFLVSGHSYLPNDADFGVVERSKPKSSEIFCLDQWCKHIEACCKKNPFRVQVITADELFTTESHLVNCNVRKFSGCGEK